MSDTTDVTSDVPADVSAPEETAGASRRRRTGGGLSAMLLPELQSFFEDMFAGRDIEPVPTAAEFAARRKALQG